MKFLPVLLLLATISQAQIVHLTTDDSAQTIYFSTALRLRGSNDAPWAKIYKSDAIGFTLVSEVASDLFSMTATTGYLRNSVSLSADGSVMVINSSTPCAFGEPCDFISTQFTDILANGADLQYPATAQVSRGGRYVLLTHFVPEMLPQMVLVPPFGLSRLDLQTGTITSIAEFGNTLAGTGGSAAPAQYGRWIAADGTILATAGSEWVLFSPSGAQTGLGVPTGGYAVFAALAQDASFVVYESGAAAAGTTPLSEIHIRRSDGSDQLLAGCGTDPSLSVDGTSLLYLAPVKSVLQAFLMNLNGGVAQQVTSEPEGLTEVVLSGDGSTVVGATSTGGLISIQLASGTRRQIIGLTPSVTIPLSPTFNDEPLLPWSVTPGSTYRLDGNHLTDQTVRATPPLGFDLNGVSVSISGRPAAVYWAYPSEIAFQVAWETPVDSQLNPLDLLVLRSGDPNWEAAVQFSGVYATFPQEVTLAMDGNTPLWAIHQDWRGFVSPEDPAAPGETVYFYATGLGPLPQSIPTGAPGPVPPLSIPRIPPTPPATSCIWVAGSANEPLVFPFIGLAPGLVGYYQVAMTVPADFAGTTLGPQCLGWGGIGGSFAVK